MRGWPLLLLAFGCNDLPGLWQIERLTVGDVTVDDAGFLDFQQKGAAGSGTQVSWLVRYTWDAETGELVPDPTPDVQATLFNYRGYLDGEGTRLDVALHADPDGLEALPASFEVPKPEGRRLTLEDPDFEPGALIWELTR